MLQARRIESKEGAARAKPARNPPYTRLSSRLLVSIPALMTLCTLGMGVLCHQIFLSYYELQDVEGSFPIEKAETMMLMTVFVGAVIAAMGGYLLARTIVSPLRSIGARLEEIVSTGRVASVAPVESIAPEIDQLGQRFDQVLESLNSYVSQRNRFILECFPGALVLLGAEGGVTTMNSAAERLIGPESASLTGRNFEEWLRAVDPQSPLAGMIHDAMAEGVFADSREIELATPSHGRYPIVATISPLQVGGDGGRAAAGYSIDFRDLRAFKGFYDQMLRADRLAAIGTFATGIAHEIRNPLGSVKGIAQLLAEELESDSKARKYLDVIIRETNRLDRVVKGILDYARPDGGPRESVDLGRLLAEALVLSKYAVSPLSSADIEFAQDYKEPARVQVQPDRMVQALLNLARNAIEAAAPAGKVRLSTAKVKDRAGKTRCEARISNTGDTISPEDLPRIFEPFFSTKTGGTGLGLAISSQIVAAHGGQITVESGGELTTFVVSLPAAEA